MFCYYQRMFEFIINMIYRTLGNVCYIFKIKTPPLIIDNVLTIIDICQIFYK